MGKYCFYKSCKSRAGSIRHNSDKLRFIPIPKPTSNIEKCERWLKAINRTGLTSVDVKKHHYVCSLHFVGGNGPTDQYPDPIPDGSVPPTSVVPLSRKNETFSIASGFPLESVTDQVQEVTLFGCTDNEPALPLKMTNFKTYSKTSVFGGVDAVHMDLENFNTLGNIAIKLEQDIQECGVEEYVTSEQTYPCASSVNQINSKDVGTYPMYINQQDAATSPAAVFNTCNGALFDSIASEFLFYRARHFRKLNWCLKLKLENGSESLCFEQTVGSSSVTLNVNNTMNTSISISSKPLTENHEFFQTLREILSFPLSSLEDLLKIMAGIDGATICQGIKGELFSAFQGKFLQTAEICPLSQCLRSKKCQLVFDRTSRTDLCQDCRMSKRILQTRTSRYKNKPAFVSSDQANHRFLSMPQIQQRVMTLRSKNRLLKRKIKVLESKVEKGIKREGIGIICEDSQELEDISKADPFKNPTSFLKLLLQEQLKILKSNKCRPRKWHSAIIEWCRFLKTLSARCYEEMCNVLILPSEGTLSKKAKEIDVEIGHGDEGFLMTSFRTEFGNIQELEEHSSEIIDESQIESDSV